MNKLIVLGAGTAAASAAIAATALLSPVLAAAEPSAQSLNVVGEPFYKAKAILKAQGATVMFGGAKAGPGALPQDQCIVDQQTVVKGGKFRLFLDCTQEAANAAAENNPVANVPPLPSAGGAPGASGAPAAPAPAQGGTYGNPIGVPIPVG